MHEPTGSPASEGDRRARAGLVRDLEAAQSALEAYNLSGEDADRLAYNQACAAFASHWKAAALSEPVLLKTPAATYRIRGNKTRGTRAPASLDAILTAAELPNKAMLSDEAPSGWGGTVVGVERSADFRADFYPKQGISLPVTSVLDFSGKQDGVTDVTFSLWQPGVINSVRLGGRERPLARDFSLPFAYYPASGPEGFLAMLMPGHYEHFRGLYLMQPYDPEKIPLLFIHGLMSSPQMWLPVLAAFEEDPELRGRFQFWLYGYPTGDPIAYLGMQLRESLARMHKRYPATNDIVVMSHSLGGLLTQLQVVDSGKSMARSVFGEESDAILAAPDNEILRSSLLFSQNPNIRRVAFIATPHLGAPLATNFIGRLGARVIQLPTALFSRSEEQELKLALRRAGIKSGEAPNVIIGLDPHSPLLASLNRKEIRIPTHSIIGVAGATREPLKDTTDTVVPYWSSYRAGATSTKVVQATHEKICTHPEALAEMKRIARLALP